MITGDHVFFYFHFPSHCFVWLLFQEVKISKHLTKPIWHKQGFNYDGYALCLKIEKVFENPNFWIFGK